MSKSYEVAWDMSGVIVVEADSEKDALKVVEGMRDSELFGDSEVRDVYPVDARRLG